MTRRSAPAIALLILAAALLTACSGGDTPESIDAAHRQYWEMYRSSSDNDWKDVDRAPEGARSTWEWYATGGKERDAEKCADPWSDTFAGRREGSWKDVASAPEGCYHYWAEYKYRP